MSPRLKVYEASIDGVNQWIVAAPNQKAALEAWGVGQNLFQFGEAQVAQAPEVIEAALAHPGVVLRRPRAGGQTFRPAEQADAQGWEAAAKAVGARKPRAGKKHAPDRGALDAAEAALKVFEAEAAGRLASAEARREAAERAERLEAAAVGRQRQTLVAARDRAAAEFARKP